MQYKLKDLMLDENQSKEFKDNYNEFLKTTYGKSVKLLQSILGITLFVSFILILIYVSILVFDVVSITNETSVIVFILFGVFFIIGFFSVMITEIIFRNMLMNYLNSKK